MAWWRGGKQAKMLGMGRRGGELRDHILAIAKGIFLEMGFERASMDEVAARAETSKRSVYAHFESKEKLFLAVIDFVRERFLDRLKVPSAYGAKPADALSLFCAQYLKVMTYEPSVQMIRVTLAESARFHEAARQHYDVVFGEVVARVAAYLKVTFDLSARASTEAAERLLGQILFPVLPRALFGIAELARDFEERPLAAKVEMKRVRAVVGDLVASLEPKAERAGARAEQKRRRA